MRVITAYYRKSNRHKWQFLIDRPAAQKDFVIAWAKNWLQNLAPKYGITQLGYTVTEVAARAAYSLKCNAQVTPIATE